VSKESQRNPGNLATFGIKNARRPAGEYKLVIRSGVNQLLSLRPALGLDDHHIALGDHVIELPGRCNLSGNLLIA
jgi:hypothetical protein